jgi:hypothetical protein
MSRALISELLDRKTTFQIPKVSSDGTTLEFSAYLGGSGTDAGLGIAADSDSRVYVAGRTRGGTARTFIFWT